LESKITVESVMRRPVWASINDTVLSIAEQMVTHNIGAIIIVRESVPVGIVCERDIIENVVKARKDPAKMRAEDIMSSPLITIKPDKSIADALKLMRDKKIRRLAVINPHQHLLVGIVTQKRLLNAR
jgi:CBS domain-containing protein